MLNNIPNDIKDLCSAIESINADGLLWNEWFFIYRDNFYGNLKYGFYKGVLTDEDVYSKISAEPDTDNDLLYCYLAAYAEWCANELGVDVPEWTGNPRSFSYADGIVLGNFVPKDLLNEDSMTDVFTYPADEFTKRGFYFRDRDQQVI